jgi:hypothetical protein
VIGRENTHATASAVLDLLVIEKFLLCACSCPSFTNRLACNPTTFTVALSLA